MRVSYQRLNQGILSVNRTNTCGRKSTKAYDKDMREYGITPINFLWGIRHIVRCYNKGLTAIPISPALSAMLHITEKESPYNYL